MYLYDNSALFEFARRFLFQIDTCLQMPTCLMHFRYTWEVTKNDDLIYDIGNLYAYEPSPIDPKEFEYVQLHDECEIVRQNPEDYIKRHARDNAQLLVNKVVFGITYIVTFRCLHCPCMLRKKMFLPPYLRPSCPSLVRRWYVVSVTSGNKQAPRPKAITKWEEFRRKKGLDKRKRGRMIEDETSGEYRPRYGYKRANDLKEAPIIEHNSSM